MDRFYILAMRTINLEDDINFGNDDIEELLNHFGDEKVFNISMPKYPPE